MARWTSAAAAAVVLVLGACAKSVTAPERDGTVRRPEAIRFLTDSADTSVTMDTGPAPADTLPEDDSRNGGLIGSGH